MRDTIQVARQVWALVLLGALACQSPPTEPAEVDQVEGSLADAQTGPGPGPQPQQVSRIAFIGNDSSGLTQVFTIKRTGDGLTQLTSFPSNHAWDLAWSPAGPSRIAFHMVPYFQGASTDHAYVMGSDGAGLQDLTPGGEHSVWDLVWAPDGTKLAVRDLTPGTNKINIKVMNADGSGVVQLASDTNWITAPAWSPDGQRLMYFARTDHPRTLFNDRGIWTIKPDGTGRTKVLDVPGADFYETVQYSPNGTKVVMCRDVNTVVMNVNGTGLVDLGLACNSETGPQWSPNGTRILTTALIGAREQIFTLDPDGSDQVQLTSGNLSADRGTWSRGGGWIAFRRGASGGTMEVWVMKADGSQKTQLTTGMKVGSGVSWGPEPGSLPY